MRKERTHLAPALFEPCEVISDADTRLELVTSRTSSGCATSCANERFALWGA